VPSEVPLEGRKQPWCPKKSESQSLLLSLNDHPTCTMHTSHDMNEADDRPDRALKTAAKKNKKHQTNVQVKKTALWAHGFSLGLCAQATCPETRLILKPMALAL